jgi:predicted lysophospholipase L1 biosynthesis ABC-type transport system permease subunit
MMTKQKSAEDLKVIRQIMEDSTKFLSLSGLSGILAGAFALIGAAVAYFFILDAGDHYYNEYMISLTYKTTSSIRISLLADAAGVFLLAITTAYYLSHQKAKKAKVKLWNSAAKKLSLEMAIGLIIGGLFCLILIYHGDLRMVASATLVFYGLTLINIAKYTHRDIKVLGYFETILGLLAGIFLNYGIFFWSIGFGIFHIIYGVVMYLKYERCMA